MATVNLSTLRVRLAALGWRAVTVRAVLLASAWCVIAEGDRASLGFGAPVVLFALAVSLALAPGPPARWSLPGLARFALAFLLGSLRAGLDVARRAFAPRLPLAPMLFRYPLHLQTGPARHLFMATLSLLPGTLSVGLDGDVLEVHALIDAREALVLQLRRLEAHVARAVGEPLEARHA
jgi:multicomponent Na+:H+ antiporter subunit E